MGSLFIRSRRLARDLAGLAQSISLAGRGVVHENAARTGNEGKGYSIFDFCYTKRWIMDYGSVLAKGFSQKKENLSVKAAIASVVSYNGPESEACDRCGKWSGNSYHSRQHTALRYPPRTLQHWRPKFTCSAGSR